MINTQTSTFGLNVRLQGLVVVQLQSSPYGIFFPEQRLVVIEPYGPTSGHDVGHQVLVMV